MDYTKLIEAIITIATVAFTGVLIPWVKSMMETEKLRKIIKYVEIAVKAAEQLFDASEGEKKKAWVMEWLTDNGISIDIDALSAMVESAVNTVHNQLKEE